MAKKPKNRKYNLKTIFLKLSLLVVFVVIVILGYLKVLEYRNIRDQVSMVSIRELIITSVENLKQPAVLDPKTGDAYFPPEKLYLPYSQNQIPLTYSETDDGSGGLEFNISNKYVIGALKSKLYSAQNLEKMFEQVPELQACLRGVRVTYEKLPDETDYNLNSSHILNNGKTVYLYSEKVCTGLNETADLLKNIQSY